MCHALAGFLSAWLAGGGRLQADLRGKNDSCKNLTHPENPTINPVIDGLTLSKIANPIRKI
jgi:hypothetical protein